ncbi:uncharacterized protein [Narcine bancroftii]|uniref:uncharacterized protein n=1 Tax=Narcine bancroftii TaxID=1343680 RepID=UPI0038316D6B
MRAGAPREVGGSSARLPSDRRRRPAMTACGRLCSQRGGSRQSLAARRLLTVSWRSADSHPPCWRQLPSPLPTPTLPAGDSLLAQDYGAGAAGAGLRAPDIPSSHNLVECFYKMLHKQAVTMATVHRSRVRTDVALLQPARSGDRKASSPRPHKCPSCTPPAASASALSASKHLKVATERERGERHRHRFQRDKVASFGSGPGQRRGLSVRCFPWNRRNRKKLCGDLKQEKLFLKTNKNPSEW